MKLKKESTVVSGEKLINLKNPRRRMPGGGGFGVQMDCLPPREYWFHQGFGSGAGGPVRPE